MSLERPRFLPPGLNPEPPQNLPDTFWGVILQTLWNHWGDPYWWPGHDAWEVAAGAILTQNTAWVNVERALIGLREQGLTTARKIDTCDVSRLEAIVRPSGYYRAKAKKLKELASWWLSRIETGTSASVPTDLLRTELLGVWGVGPETADCILCYALGRPVFVVDAYTIRIAERLRKPEKPYTYRQIQEEVHAELPHETLPLNYLHGLLVVLAKQHCTARNPDCLSCPLKPRCKVGMSV